MNYVMKPSSVICYVIKLFRDCWNTYILVAECFLCIRLYDHDSIIKFDLVDKQYVTFNTIMYILFVFL